MLAGSRTMGVALLALAAAILVGAASSHAAVEATCMGEPATIVGTENSDTLNGTEGEDVIVGLGGDDLIRGQGGADVICGGDGNDYLYGSNGGLALDFLSGDAGDDVIDGGSKLGGIVVYSEAPGPVNVDLSALSATGWGTDRLILISGVLGSTFADTINGGARTDVLAGLGGDDTITAGGGSDLVLADPGNDRIDGGASGGDTIDFAASPHRVIVNLSSGRASGLGADVVTGFEHVTGTKYADVLTGNGAANRLQGGGGNDRLLGSGGRDTLTGQQGRDFADGGPARDICSAERKRRCP
jgi:Ca2+-binding RTX toxin-like protein